MGNGHADAIKVIVAVGAFVETQDDEKATIQVQVAVSALVKTQDNEKATPLHWAAVKGNADAIKALVAAG